ncbi:unnamed protein product, partial [Mesorhabditis belari]|uniref:Uncharacterized protein n=1 Tax=Mesorhabditis belari TaxID=2138241 RepID=A0AAF3EV57_9BILA
MYKFCFNTSIKFCTEAEFLGPDMHRNITLDLETYNQTAGGFHHPEITVTGLLIDDLPENSPFLWETFFNYLPVQKISYKVKP